jgi:hypothetical protein
MTTIRHLSRACELLEELAIHYADARDAGEVFGLAKAHLDNIDLLRRATNRERLRILEFEVLGI